MDLPLPPPQQITNVDVTKTNALLQTDTYVHPSTINFVDLHLHRSTKQTKQHKGRRSLKKPKKTKNNGN